MFMSKLVKAVFTLARFIEKIIATETVVTLLALSSATQLGLVPSVDCGQGK
jgi:hypothetical protein